MGKGLYTDPQKKGVELAPVEVRTFIIDLSQISSKQKIEVSTRILVTVLQQQLNQS